jgi:hypothetical protein
MLLNDKSLREVARRAVFLYMPLLHQQTVERQKAHCTAMNRLRPFNWVAELAVYQGREWPLQWPVCTATNLWRDPWQLPSTRWEQKIVDGGRVPPRRIAQRIGADQLCALCILYRLQNELDLIDRQVIVCIDQFVNGRFARLIRAVPRVQCPCDPNSRAPFPRRSCTTRPKPTCQTMPTSRPFSKSIGLVGLLPQVARDVGIGAINHSAWPVLHQ